MKRFNGLLLAAISTSFFATGAWAATATIKTASTGVQVGKEGAWKDAKPGMPVSDADFVKIPENASATIVLPDNSTKDFAGRAIVPGRRLSDKSSAGAMIWFSQGVQKLAGSSDTTTGANGIKKDANMLGQKRHLVYDGADGAMHTVSDAVVADVDFSAGHYEQAQKAASGALENPKSTPVDKQLAHLILGELLANGASYNAALKELDLAAVANDEGTDTQGVKRRALMQRGQVQTQLGNDAKARADFETLAKSADGVAAAQARFFLGALAVGENDSKTARTWFEQLKGANDTLYATGMAMLEPAK